MSGAQYDISNIFVNIFVFDQSNGGELVCASDLVLSWIRPDGVAGDERFPNAPLGWCLNYNTIFKTIFQMGSISMWWFYQIALVKH